MRHITQILIRAAFVLAFGFGLLLFAIFGRIAWTPVGDFVRPGGKS